MGRLANFIREQSIVLDGQKKTKMLSLDRQFEDMEAERDLLKTENLHLKAKVTPLEKDVERLQQRIQEASAKPARKMEDDLHLSEPEETVLIFLAACELKNTVAPGLKLIAKVLKVNAINAEVLLISMQEQRLLYCDSSYVEARYNLLPLGKKYLVKKKLL